MIKVAHQFIKKEYDGIFLKFSDIPHIKHLEEVAQLLWSIDDDDITDNYVVCLLHDVLLNTKNSSNDIEKVFGRDIVNGIANLYVPYEEMKSTSFNIVLCDTLSHIVHMDNDSIPNMHVSRCISTTNNVINDIKRKLSYDQEELINRIHKMIYFLRCKRDIW